MRSTRPTVALFRVVLAVLFGFMSLGHGPLMTFAHARAMPTQHETAAAHHAHAPAVPLHHQMGGAEHGDHAAAAASASPPQTLLPNTGAACYSVGCFVSLASLAIDAPAASSVPLGRLLPGIAHVIAPTPAEPADPPPRLQV